MTYQFLTLAHWVGTGIERPHIVGTFEGRCWCHPARVECRCGEGHEPVWGHSMVEARPDTQPRMVSWSLTWPGLVGPPQ